MNNHLHSTLIKLRKSFVNMISKFIDPLSPPGALLWFAGVDFSNRYSAVSKELLPGSILDVGSGGRSVLCLKGYNVISVDISRKNSLDIIASASHLPLKNSVFSNVVSVDALEHISSHLRKQTLSELKRVSDNKVIVHCPLQNGIDFVGRKCDLSLQDWLKNIYNSSHHFTEEHVENIEPSPDLLINMGFTVCGLFNANLWLKCMTLIFLNPKLSVIWRSLAWIYYIFHQSENNSPPYWGAICTYTKNNTNA